MTPSKRVFVAILGVGGVGRCFLAQLESLVKRRWNPELVLYYVASSKKAAYSDDWSGISVANALSRLSKSTQEPLGPSALADRLKSAPSPVVLVDNTSSQDIADSYPIFLSRGVSIVTPNKKAFSGSWKLWQDIFAASAHSGALVYHEASVGAGLPVVSTLKDLLDTGDEVTKIEGVFSGTMSFLFNSFAPISGSGGQWSAAVKEAKELGLAGLQVESPTSFPVQSLIPKELETASNGDEFLQKLPQFDSQMDDIKSGATKEGKAVRFVGSIDMTSKQVKVGLERFDRSHPIAALKGSDNIISFYTKRIPRTLVQCHAVPRWLN
ncbi:hypothetical protein P8C59_003205 [Phyllachora maydis]|uniref:homoserine dehydrogenase n=1 Tax=Phyllachora maydis TaxID=1825666 RepID=A0AAD9HZR8_9PEZI|nr:hypothetical protein P8C59_003205 [Phyllachora maydis]